MLSVLLLSACNQISTAEENRQYDAYVEEVISKTESYLRIEEVYDVYIESFISYELTEQVVEFKNKNRIILYSVKPTIEELQKVTVPGKKN